MLNEVLAIDAGNTRIKWGVFDVAGTEPMLKRSGVVPHEDLARIFAGAVPPNVIASNVAGARVATLLGEQCKQKGATLHVILSQAAECGVRSGYDNPAQLGTDRWAALIGARKVSRRATLVVMAGTATTVDALTAEGAFLGGLIVPGVTLMRSSLNRNTAQLGLEAGRFAPFPTSTADAITSGAVQASVGAVARMAEALAAKAGEAPHLILSGGAANELAPRLMAETPFAISVREHLVLEGLVEIARQNVV